MLRHKRLPLSSYVKPDTCLERCSISQALFLYHCVTTSELSLHLKINKQLYLSVDVFSTSVLIGDTVNKYTNRA